jgi:hypothetical protein
VHAATGPGADRPLIHPFGTTRQEGTAP